MYLLSNALDTRSLKGRVMHHSDQGVQYTSSQFRKLLDKNNIVCSMSTKGNPWTTLVRKVSLINLKVNELENKYIIAMLKLDKIYSSI